jgi:hypothetical protein
MVLATTWDEAPGILPPEALQQAQDVVSTLSRKYGFDLVERVVEEGREEARKILTCDL